MNQAKIVECDIKVIDIYLLLANLLLLLLLSFFSRSIPITNTVKLPPLPITITYYYYPIPAVYWNLWKTRKGVPELPRLCFSLFEC